MGGHFVQIGPVGAKQLQKPLDASAAVTLLDPQLPNLSGAGRMGPLKVSSKILPTFLAILFHSGAQHGFSSPQIGATKGRGDHGEQPVLQSCVSTW
jgi:hypothetical protein